MLIYLSNFFFATLLVRVQCRSIISSDLNLSDDETETMKQNSASFVSASDDFDYHVNSTNVGQRYPDSSLEIIPEDVVRLITSEGLLFEDLLDKFVTSASNVTDRNEKMAQLVRRIEPMVKLLPSNLRIDESLVDGPRGSQEIDATMSDDSSNVILIDGNNWIDEYVDAESNDDNESHVKSRFDDTSMSHVPIYQSSDVTENDDNSDHRDTDELDDMIADFHNDIRGIEKYFGKLCRKHRTAS